MNTNFTNINSAPIKESAELLLIVIQFQIECLKGTWPFGSFCLLEAETLYDGISSHIENSGGFNE